MVSDRLRCPACGRVHEVHSDARGGTALPSPGAVSICWGCAEISVFTEVGLRAPTSDEATEIAADPYIQRVRAAITAVANGGRRDGQVPS